MANLVFVIEEGMTGVYIVEVILENYMTQWTRKTRRSGCVG
jgi:hypothetical protein